VLLLVHVNRAQCKVVALFLRNRAPFLMEKHANESSLLKYSCGLFACRGLDSTSCAQCIELLRFLARGGRTIIITIHQPSARIFERFDSLYAVADGRCIYKGSPQALLPFLASKNLECPPYHNPADFCKYLVFFYLFYWHNICWKSQTRRALI
jgi:hypothetical protein